MKNIPIILALLLISSSCSNHKTTYKQPSKKQELATQVRKNVAYKLETEKGLSPCGIGAQMMDKIKMLALGFNYYKPINICEARELLIYASKQFINEVNENNEIHPYLANHPFTSKNIEICIYLYSPSRRNVGPNELSLIKVQDGLLSYDINDPISNHLKTILTETFEEAVEKVKNGESKEPFVSSESAPTISKEDRERLTKSIGYVSDDGSLWSPDENGDWIKDTKCEGK